jgi:hypothetical protein
LAVLVALCQFAAAATLDCGNGVTTSYLSGCTACTTVTFNRTDNWKGEMKNKTKPGKAGVITMPSCTACAANFRLSVKGGPGKNKIVDSEDSPVRFCVCADGFGVSITGAVNVTRGKKTRSMSLFDCKACGTNEVALTKASGLKPVLDDGTKQWSLKLRSKLKAEDKKRKSLNTKKADVGKEGKKQWGSPDKYAGSPYVRGACVPCPAGTKKSGAACVV